MAVEWVIPFEDELTSYRKEAEEVRRIRAALAEQLTQLPRHIEQHARAVLEPFEARTRADLQRILAESLPKELAREHEAMKASIQDLRARIHEPIAIGVENVLPRVRAELSRELGSELHGLNERGRTVAEELRKAADLLRTEREATRAQSAEIGASREELRVWLQEQQAISLEQISHRLEQLTSELESRAAQRLEQRIKVADTDIQAQQATADLSHSLSPLLDRALNAQRELLSLLGTLQHHVEHCDIQTRALHEQKDGIQAWMTERIRDFQNMLHDSLLETRGQIRGQVQMAVEMAAQPMDELRADAMQQLQGQASVQTRRFHEQLVQAGERLEALHRQIDSAVRESLRIRAAETSATFGREIAQVAQRSIEEWRSALARNLESITIRRWHIAGSPVCFELFKTASKAQDKISLGQKLSGADK
jgi:hypothetical protein